ncbi:MAG TPA: peptide chain release factor 2 [Anaerolineales bacterium]|nr:peptide chain release factor 2 [Anaerolineales bacterium]
MEDILAQLQDSRSRLQDLLVRLDLAAQEKRLAELERSSEDPALWNDPERAQETMRQLARVREEVQSWAGLNRRLAEALELTDLGDEGLRAEMELEAEAIRAEVERRELEALLSGPYDRDNAFLSIHAGAGGTDSQDWASMLQRMYLRWAEERGYKAEILDQAEGEEAGLKSVTMAVNGENAYGYLRAEKGVHRLVRLSPFDSAHRRHTSFALVEAYPEVERDDEIKINPADLRIDTFRSAGAGGQNVQKNETAIRITHVPTGIVVTCQNERSQTQNRENAMRVLRARLLDLRRQEQEEERARLKGEHVKAEWGSQIRSYVLHPYQLVKDHRTGFESSNTTAVLNGAIDGFIEAYLRSSIASRA